MSHVSAKLPLESEGSEDSDLSKSYIFAPQQPQSLSNLALAGTTLLVQSSNIGFVNRLLILLTSFPEVLTIFQLVTSIFGLTWFPFTDYLYVVPVITFTGTLIWCIINLTGKELKVGELCVTGLCSALYAFVVFRNTLLVIFPCPDHTFELKPTIISGIGAVLHAVYFKMVFLEYAHGPP